MRRDPWLAREWVPRLLTREYDPRDIPIEHKRGGTDRHGHDGKTRRLRCARQHDSRESARATAPIGSPGINGFSRRRNATHTWCWRKPAAGLSCFFMPRRLPDGTLNGIHIQRLKDKLGNRSNASSEVEFIDAWAHLLGEEGRGVPTILEMGTYTRLDCVTGTAGMMRQAVVQALHHARHREAFGSLLIEQPLMRSVLADLALESEAATALSLRLARAFDSDSAERDCAAPRAHLGRQILGLQARLRIGSGSHGGARRQRLHGRAAAGAHRARNAGEFDLGRLGQHHVPRRTARLRQIAGHARGRAGRVVGGARPTTGISTRRSSVSPPRWRRAGSRRTRARICAVVRHADAGERAARRRGGRAQGRERAVAEAFARPAWPRVGLGCRVRRRRMRSIDVGSILERAWTE